MSTHARFTIDADVTPRFTACYLRVAGDECAFIEAHTVHALPRLLGALAAQGKRPEQVRYVIVTHAHLDHAAGASALMAACPNATLLAHPRAARHLIDPAKLVKSATAVYGAERFQALYGTIPPIDAARVKTMDDGASVELGDATLTMWHTAGHANHHFVVDDPTIDTVFTGDTFGLVYPALQHHGRFAIPSTSPTNFDAEEARKSIDRVLHLRRGAVCPTHFDAWTDATAIAQQLRRFIDRAEQWVDEAAGSGDTPVAMEQRLRGAWTEAIHAEAPHLTREDLALLALDIELNAQGLAFAAVARRESAHKVG
jgi:glyoxylase-like metal-dependent hydrolase (beta-lactamase superfamily II)